MRLDQDNRFSRTDRTARTSFSRSSSLTNGASLRHGASMRRCLMALVVLLGFLASAGQVSAQKFKVVSGYIPAGTTQYFFPRVPQNSAADTIYYIAGDLHIAGKLLIAEGAEVWFNSDSRIIDSAGGKIIANGYATIPDSTNLDRRIEFRGAPEGDSSFEWGHIVILPNSDSAYFANVHFTNFRKRTSVDQSDIYSPTLDPIHANFNSQIDNAINGYGGVIATFSQKTYIYNAIVDTCFASFGGGAFAFLQSPPNWPTPDDGRLALKNRQVCWLTVRDTKAYNAEVGNIVSDFAQGGAIYMSSNASGYLMADSLTGYLGHNAFVTGTPNSPQSFSAAQDVMLFERCSATNTFSNPVDFAKGGAIYVGTNTALIMEQATFNNDSANESVDLNSLGGAIAVSAYSGSPNENFPSTQGNAGDQMPGLEIKKTATFAGCVAGVGGAIQLSVDADSLNIIPPVRLVIDGENPITEAGVTGLVRDSGLILFTGNIAYTYGGAIYAANQVYVKGYLAPWNFPWPGGIDSVEMRAKFYNNVAGEGGGGIYLDGNAGGTPDIIQRRCWFLSNSVNPYDSRVNRGSVYNGSVEGGGAEYVGFRDSTFSTEFNSNFVVGGNGGGVMIQDAIASGNAVPINRFFVEDQYNALNPQIQRDTGVNYSAFPTDQRALTRFINNMCQLGPDSASLYSYDDGVAHGRGGGLYIRITSGYSPIVPFDSTILSRVRFEQNQAYSGSAIWSDQYDLKLMSNQCLIANNFATSLSSALVNLDSSNVANPGDPNAGATIWADFEGALPSYGSNSRGDAIYDNIARYVLRLPVSPIVGQSGVDTLRGNFWGETGPDVNTEEISTNNNPVEQNTFFVGYYNGCFTNIYEPNSNPPVQYFAPTIGFIPDTLLMEGRVYDLYDRGNNMKVADYSERRFAPSEAFALGLPANITRMHRFTRNIFDTSSNYVNKIDLMQTDFVGPQPLGYPLFLQADVPINDSDRDDYAKNYTTFLVIDQTTNEFVRVNLQELVAAENDSAKQETYQGRLDFVPDSSVAERHPNLRSNTLYTLALIRPSVMTYAEVQRASLLEDSAALHGREYSLSPSDLIAPGDSVFMDCESGGPSATSTWYAGEKYHTLPVRPGDRIAVISRTELWKFGAAYALANGLQFVIGDVLPPSFVGDIPTLQSNTYTPNVKFVKRDINYSGTSASNTLFRVAGYDANNFYDPRFLFNAGNYTQLGITVTPDLFPGDVVPTGGNYIAQNALDSVEAHVRLFHGTLFEGQAQNGDTSWIHQRVIYNQNITGSNGYVLLYGQPKNPDIVPGGEAITATLTNFPPNYTSEYDLLNAFPGSVLGPDSESLSMWVFPPYMNCARIPDSTTAIPDTLCVRATSTSYTFKIIVEDSLPVFKALPESSCGFSTPVGIITDSLRYSIDLNTDVEYEDSVAAADSLPAATSTDVYQTGPMKGTLVNHPAWDFRYGRTSYNFAAEPSWMVEPQGGIYVPIDSSDPNFLRKGIIRVRIDSLSAVSGTGAGGPYLLPIPQVNNELNLDTVISVVANDGHTGMTLQTWPVTILYAPTILTTTLPDAKEGVDYSLNFDIPDSVKRILVENLNPGHPYTYHLIYKGSSEKWYRDFPDKVPAPVGYTPSGSPIYVAPDTVGGSPDSVVGYSPDWISIDPYSGVLTGIPGDTDAPAMAGAPCGGDTLTVVVSDGTNKSYCVAAWINIPFNVDSVNHAPAFVAGPGQICVMNDSTFCDSVLVYDPDLRRMDCAVDTLTVSTTNGSPFTIDSQSTAVVTGQLSNDTVKLQVCGSFNEDQSYFLQSPIPVEYITLTVHDAAGLTDTLRLPVHVGEAPAFECEIYVSNDSTALHPLTDIQALCFGAGQSATDGIDQQYCEYELAPAPPLSAFDARWILPIGGNIEGTTVDIRANANALITWQVEFRPGNDGGGAGSLYPVQICWNRSCLDSAALPVPFSEGHFYLRDPQSEQEFSINMATGQGPIDNSLYTITPIGSDSICLQIRNQGLINAIIVFEPNTSAVNSVAQAVNSIQPNYPNPFANSTMLNFSLAERSNVRIDIYDVKGTLVRTLVNEMDDAGTYPVTWDGTDATGANAPDGTYIATMTAGSFTSSVKMSLERGTQQ